MSDQENPLEQAAVELARLLSKRPAGLVTDIDGTISRIALIPSAATVEPEARAALAALARRLDLVAAVSGRSAPDAAAMVGLPELVYVGNHGMERLVNGQLTIADEALDFRPVLHDILAQAARTITVPGVIFEDKGVSASVHYRGAPEPALAKPVILSVLAPLAAAHGLRVTDGRMVVELRPPVVINKGTAIRELVSDYHLRSLVFLGDDVTDIDAMAALVALRREGRIDGATVGVVATESPRQLAELCDIALPAVDQVAELLARLVACLTPADGQLDHIGSG